MKPTPSALRSRPPEGGASASGQPGAAGREVFSDGDALVDGDVEGEQPPDQGGELRAQTGGITESDVMLASASNAVIIGFNVRPLADARRAAQAEGVDIRTYSVIYKITEDLRAAMEGMLDTVEVEDSIGEAEVREVFKASKVGRIAGCVVTEGRVQRDASVRLVREGTVIWTGQLDSLRRFKDAVQTVEEGQDCGIVLDGYADVKVGDVLEFFSTRQVEQTLS